MEKYEDGIALVLLFLTLLATAFVLKFCWLWFVVPIFGVTAITFTQALGLLFIKNILTLNLKKDFSINDCLKTFAYLTIVLVAAYILK